MAVVARRGTEVVGAAFGLGVLFVLTAAGCGGGQIAYSNESSSDVTVQLGGKDAWQLAPGSGGVVYTGDCYDGPVSVTYDGGQVAQLAGPVCPGQQLLVDDAGADVVELESGSALGR